MNFGPANSTTPRQFFTIGGILVGHAVILAAFLAAPSVRFKAPPKETVLMMVAATQPMVPAPANKVNEKPQNPQPTAISPEVRLTQPELKDTIHVASNHVIAPEPTPNITAPTTTPVSAPVKVESQGPKIISAVEYIQAPQADYPSIAKRMGEEGRVVMQVLVNDKGRAEKVEIIKSSGFNRLDESAKTALMRAIFKPYVEDGKSMSVLATASINFSLRG